ncbi:hypothetical protein KCP75_22115 [Salmonella enterica subsp. enterica]|nr:hypothetical protein KCP75_22115 [Salmonella enterica subsp. enterica]
MDDGRAFIFAGSTKPLALRRAILCRCAKCRTACEVTLQPLRVIRLMRRSLL